jgi:hypothetical protein
VRGGGAGKARRLRFLAGARALRYCLDSVLESECERNLERERECERESERPNGLLLTPPKASASIDRVEECLVRFLLTETKRPFESRSTHVPSESKSMG